MLKTNDGGPAAKTEFRAILTDNIAELLREQQDEAFSFFVCLGESISKEIVLGENFVSFKIKSHGTIKMKGGNLIRNSSRVKLNFQIHKSEKELLFKYRALGKTVQFTKLSHLLSFAKPGKSGQANKNDWQF